MWGRFNQCEISAANWILHSDHATDDLETMEATQNALSSEAWRRELSALAASAPEALEVIDLPSETGPAYEVSRAKSAPLIARQFHGRIARDWRISSFSSLTLARDDELPDHDPLLLDPAPAESAIEEQGSTPFRAAKKRALACTKSLSRSTSPGRAAWRKWFPGTGRLRVLAPGMAGRRDRLRAEHADRGVGAGLGASSYWARVAAREVEFYLPVSQLSAENLLRTLGPETAAGLRFEPRSGMLKGFIDLVVMHEGRFYILDWKSNHLGHAGSYPTRSRPRCGSIITACHTRYPLALHRYLGLRLPDYDYDTHFGGVFYVFLRGVDPAQPGSGIFPARPTRETIEELSLSLSGML